MAQSSFLGDVLGALFERRRAAAKITDKRSIEDMCRALLDSEGEVSGIHLATAILDRYSTLENDARLEFFKFLNNELEVDPKEISRWLEHYSVSGSVQDYHAFTTSSEPKRQELLRRLNQSPQGTAKLVRMRVDLLGLLKEHPNLKRTNFDFVHLLRSWFNRGFLVLRQISWDTPASILEKIVAYEAVHAINDWEDLRRRLYPPDRRCYAYFHPAMPDEPLIFVEVALAKSVPNSIQAVLAEDRTHLDAVDTSVAVFYSISNCQDGLHGVSFGNLLIKQVVDLLRHELPQLNTFVTLSPIPGFNRWLVTHKGSPIVDTVLTGKGEGETVQSFASHYLLNEKSKRGGPLDPVARFHLNNGAQIHAVHAAADLTENGLAQSCGAMVNYIYNLDMIEKNHEMFVLGHDIPASKPVVSAASGAMALLENR